MSEFKTRRSSKQEIITIKSSTRMSEFKTRDGLTTIEDFVKNLLIASELVEVTVVSKKYGLEGVYHAIDINPNAIGGDDTAFTFLDGDRVYSEVKGFEFKEATKDDVNIVLDYPARQYRIQFFKKVNLIQW